MTPEERFAKLEARLERAEAEIALEDTEITRVRARVAELETKLGQNSSNSHEPPSSDPPGTRPPPKPRGSKRGGQLPKAQCHEYARHGAECRDCGEETWAKLPPGAPAHMFGASPVARGASPGAVHQRGLR